MYATAKRGGKMQELFGFDIPDPNQVKSNTRETMTIRDVLNPTRPTMSANPYAVMGGRTT